MDKEVALFTEPEELITWADQFDILLNITREEAELLLNYMEGHDYAIGHNEEGKLYQVDIAEENGELNNRSDDDSDDDYDDSYDDDDDDYGQEEEDFNV